MAKVDSSLQGLALMRACFDALEPGAGQGGGQECGMSAFEPLLKSIRRVIVMES